MLTHLGSDPPLYKRLLVLLLWTGTSFLCHFSGKTFLASLSTAGSLQQDSSGFYSWIIKIVHALALTVLQLVFCHGLVGMNSASTHSTQYRMAQMGHILATFATNFSMAVMFASSTFAIKLMEPITSAVVQHLVIGTDLTPVAVISLPVIVGGAVVFAGNPLEYSSTSLGTLAALTSNLILAFRNVAIKQMSSQGLSPMRLEMSPGNTVLAVVLSFFFCSLSLTFETSQILPPGLTFTLAMGLTSSLFHVAYSYVSTGMVLKKISVVSHAVANILKRVLVVLLLYAFGKRVASISNFLGLVCCTAGLFVYAWDKMRQGDTIIDKGFQRKTFLLCGFGSMKVLPRLLIVLVSVSVVLLICFSPGKVDVVVKRPSEQKTFFKNTSAIEREGTKYFSRNTFLANGLRRPTDEELHPNLDDFQSQDVANIKSFLNSRIIKNPTEGNYLSEKLTKSSEIIRETQRIHFNILEDALKEYKYGMLIDIAAFENKGDPCIAVGEMYFLKRINLKIIYYCSFEVCSQDIMEKARDLADEYSNNEIVILVHGGGNIIGYAANDYIRFRLFQIFYDFSIFVFPQSIWMKDPYSSHVKKTIKHYCCHPNLTIVLRDLVSYGIAKDLYKGSTRLLMAPDMAFQIGRVERFMSPVFDILWLKRADGETPGYKIIDKVPNNLRVHFSDWWTWRTPRAGNNLEKAFYVATNGFFYLQRGRVVITDRLHGHILCTLMDIPHVMIDNKYKKISAYHNTWTKSLENAVITYDPSKALDLAIGLLKKYHDTLPPIVPFIDIEENFIEIDKSKPIVGYP